jgi:hypothetical protein
MRTLLRGPSLCSIAKSKEQGRIDAAEAKAVRHCIFDHAMAGLSANKIEVTGSWVSSFEVERWW